MLADPKRFKERMDIHMAQNPIGFQSLWLMANEDLGTDGTELDKFLAFDKTLVELIIAHHQFGDKGVQDIAKGLKTNATLRTLFLHLPLLGNGGIRALAKAIIINRSLETIFLIGNKLTLKGAKTIGQMIQSKKFTPKILRLLYLDKNRLGDAGAKPIFAAVEKDRSLEKLVLTENGITDDSCQAIANVIQHNRTLKTIDLRWNKFANINTLRMLASALQKNTTLQELHLNENSFDPFSSEGSEIASLADNIKKLLERNKKIAEERGFDTLLQQVVDPETPRIDLHNYDMNLERAKRLGQALGSSQSIKQLCISSHACGDPGVIEFAQGLVTNQTLTSLKIVNSTQNVSVGIEGLRAIAEALRNNTTLLEFHYFPRPEWGTVSAQIAKVAEEPIDQILEKNRLADRRARAPHQRPLTTSSQQSAHPLLTPHFIAASAAAPSLQNQPTQQQQNDQTSLPFVTASADARFQTQQTQRDSEERKHSTRRSESQNKQQ